MIKRILNFLLNFFASLNLTIFLLAVIALLIILQASSAKLLTALKDWQWLGVIASKDFYHSRAFIVLLLLFCTNLLACNSKRLPKTIKLFRDSSRVLTEDLITSLPLAEKITVHNQSVSSAQLSSVISAHFRRLIAVTKEPGQLHLYAETGRSSHLGFYLAHVSILVIVVGVMLATTGFEHSFEIAKDQVLDPLIIHNNRGQKQALDFSLLCEDIKNVYGQETSRVTKHQCKLSILENGAKIKTQEVNFSKPLHYKGINIFQVRFSRKAKYATIKVTSQKGARHVVEVKRGGNFIPKGSQTTLLAIRFQPDAVQLTTTASSERIWVSRAPVKFSLPDLEDYRFSLLDITNRETTRLKAVRDPGRELIWYAAFCMLAGFALVFFLPHRRLWVSATQEEKGTIITLAGDTTKDFPAFKATFEQIANRCKNVL